MTLLERWDYGTYEGWRVEDVTAIRRALAIAQAVEEKPSPRYWHANDWRLWIMERAYELLRGGDK